MEKITLHCFLSKCEKKTLSSLNEKLIALREIVIIVVFTTVLSKLVESPSKRGTNDTKTFGFILFE